MLLEHLHETGPGNPAVTAENPDKWVTSVNTRGEPCQVTPAKTADPQNHEQLYDYCLGADCYATKASLVAQMVNNLAPDSMQDTQVWSLGLEDLLEEGIAIHSSSFLFFFFKIIYFLTEG